MNATDYLKGLFIGHLFRTGTWAKPTDLYVALFTAAPTDVGGGTEVSGGSYARVSRAPLDANWAAPEAGSGATSNVAALVFATPTAAWGTLTHFGLFDAATGGNLLVWGALDVPLVVSSGTPVSFGAGGLIVVVA